MNIVKLSRAVEEWNRLNNEEDYWLEKYKKLDGERAGLRKKITVVEERASRKFYTRLTESNKVANTYWENYKKALKAKQDLSIKQRDGSDFERYRFTGQPDEKY